jgi:pimeloyl-ACP methyl ester carboxylesterase
MRRVARAAIAAAAVLLWACGIVPTIQASAASGSVAAARPASGGVVILLRGGLNVFSTGMDELAVKLRAAGVDARSEPHADWPKLAVEARQRYVKTKRPFVLIGHSWGALAAILVASELNKSGTPVDLMILYDTTETVKIPPNVRHVINFNSKTTIGLGLTVTGLSGFHGRIDNIDVPEFGHLDMDNAAPLHKRSIAEVLKVIRPGARTVGR